MYDAAAFHNAPHGTYEDRPKWLAGHMNMLATPKVGIVGLSAEDRNILLEYQHEVQDGLQEMEDLVSRIVLLASHEEGDAAGGVHEALWDVEGDMEIYAPGNLIYENLRRARAAIDKYGDEARVALRIRTAPSAGKGTDPGTPAPHGL